MSIVVIETDMASLSLNENPVNSDVDVNTNNIKDFNSECTTIDNMDMSQVVDASRKKSSNLTSSQWIRSCKFYDIPGVEPFRFKLQVTTKLSNFKRAFMRMTGRSNVTFIYRGRSVKDSDTAQSLHLEDGFHFDIL